MQHFWRDFRSHLHIQTWQRTFLLPSFDIFLPLAWGCVPTPKVCIACIPPKILLWCQLTLRPCNDHQTGKLVTYLKNEILLKISIYNFFKYFLSIEHKGRLHMCPLQNFDTTWYYNIHKLSRKNFLKFFGLQKTITIDHYGGGGGLMDPNPLFRQNNLDWMKAIRKRKICMVVLIS